jgi:hypothetical protein
VPLSSLSPTNNPVLKVQPRSALSQPIGSLEGEASAEPVAVFNDSVYFVELLPFRLGHVRTNRPAQLKLRPPSGAAGLMLNRAS